MIGESAQPLPGRWLSTWPASPDTTLPNSVVLYGLRARLGLPAAGAHSPCQHRKGTGLHACGYDLDAFGRHAQTCSWSLVIRRHNMIRDTLVAFARQAGLLARIEQTIHVEPVRYTPGTRPTHTADAIFHDLAGLPVCVDVRVTATPVLADVQTHLCAQEAARRREYGTSPAADPLRLLFDGVVPAIFDTAGQCSPACQQLLSWLVQKHSRYLESLHALSWSRAAAQSQQLYVRLSCALLKAESLALDYCTGAAAADADVSPSTPQPSMPSQPAAAALPEGSRLLAAAARG
eukprot:3094710-Amphidinium_carterae.1